MAMKSTTNVAGPSQDAAAYMSSMSDATPEPRMVKTTMKKSVAKKIKKKPRGKR